MAIDNFQCARHSVVSIIEPTMVEPGERKVQNKKFSEGWKMPV